MDIFDSLDKIRDILESNAKELLLAVKEGKCSLEQATNQLGEFLSESDTQLILQMQKTISDRMTVYDREGKPHANPLYTAAIVERVFIDGDVPELRTGPLPKGGKPAVPVVTDTINPVMVGLMLERASYAVSKRLEALLTPENDKALEVLGGEGQLAPTGVEGYEAGEFPLAIETEEPSVTEISNLSADQCRSYAYKTIATTQGRRTLEPTIQRLLARRLGTGEGKVLHPVAQARWTIHLPGVAQEITSDFSPVDTSVAVLARDLINKAGPSWFDTVEVSSVSDISGRVFGWSAKVGVKS